MTLFLNAHCGHCIAIRFVAMGSCTHNCCRHRDLYAHVQVAAADLQARDARSAHENRRLDVRDGTSHYRVERRLALAKRLYAGELPDAALQAFADWHVREKLDEAVRILDRGARAIEETAGDAMLAGRVSPLPKEL
jgi:hypothetical protein